MVSGTQPPQPWRLPRSSCSFLAAFVAILQEKEMRVKGGYPRHAPHLPPHLPGPQGVSPEDDAAVPTPRLDPVVERQDVGGEAALRGVPAGVPITCRGHVWGGHGPEGTVPRSPGHGSVRGRGWPYLGSPEPRCGSRQPPSAGRGVAQSYGPTSCPQSQHEPSARHVPVPTYLHELDPVARSPDGEREDKNRGVQGVGGFPRSARAQPVRGHRHHQGWVARGTAAC